MNMIRPWTLLLNMNTVAYEYEYDMDIIQYGSQRIQIYLDMLNHRFGRLGPSIDTDPVIQSQRHGQKSSRIFVKPHSGSETPTCEQLDAIKNVVILKLKLAGPLGSIF